MRLSGFLTNPPRQLGGFSICESQAVELIITETLIRQDDDGRYCLNDLHRASGGHANHRPTTTPIH